MPGDELLDIPAHVFLAPLAIGAVVVSVDLRSGLGTTAHEALERRLVRLLDDRRGNPPAAAVVSAGNNGFADAAAPELLALAAVLVLLQAADVGFIDLDGAREAARSGLQALADAMGQVPGGLVYWIPSSRLSCRLDTPLGEVTRR